MYDLYFKAQEDKPENHTAIEPEVACESWLAVVSGVQSTDSGGSGWPTPPPPTADGYMPMTAYNTTAES